MHVLVHLCLQVVMLPDSHGVRLEGGGHAAGRGGGGGRQQGAGVRGHAAGEGNIREGGGHATAGGEAAVEGGGAAGSAGGGRGLTCPQGRGGQHGEHGAGFSQGTCIGPLQHGSHVRTCRHACW